MQEVPTRQVDGCNVRGEEKGGRMIILVVLPKEYVKKGASK